MNRKKTTSPALPEPMSRDETVSSDQDPAVRHELLTTLAKRLAPIGGIGIEDKRPMYPNQILEHGRQFKQRVLLKPGIAQQCHLNTARLWAEDPKTNQFVTGYGLARQPLVAEDGPKSLSFWVVHSWVLRRKTLLETTFQHDAYYGVVLPATVALKVFFAEVIPRECPGGVMSEEFMSRYAHLRPIMMEAMRDPIDDLPPEQLLDLLIVQIGFLGVQAEPLLAQARRLREPGTLTREKVVVLREGLSLFFDLLFRLGNQPGEQ